MELAMLGCKVVLDVFADAQVHGANLWFTWVVLGVAPCRSNTAPWTGVTLGPAIG